MFAFRVCHLVGMNPKADFPAADRRPPRKFEQAVCPKKSQKKTTVGRRPLKITTPLNGPQKKIERNLS